MDLSGYVTRLFGSKPTVAQLETELQKVEQALAAAPARIMRANAALNNISAMTDDEHAAAEAEAQSARREAKRLEARVDEVRLALTDAKLMEADAAFAARRKAIHKRVDGEYPKLLTRLEAKMLEIAEIAAVMEDIEREARGLNYELQQVRRDPTRNLPDAVETPGDRYFTEPETVTPARTVTHQKWQYLGHQGWHDVCVYVERDGKTVPEIGGAELRTFEQIIPEKRRPGRRMSTPTTGLVLPATRLDGEPHWPRRA